MPEYTCNAELIVGTRIAVCRGCSKTLHKGAKKIAFYSWSNGGMSIQLCLDCIKTMNNLVEGEQNA